VTAAKEYETSMQLPSKNSVGRRRILQILRIVLCGLLFGLLATRVWGQSKRTDLADASLESLMNMRVTSASKSPERFAQVAAAMYVITQDDIRRSNATSIAELLRMVPGLDVAHIDASTWAISSRGFNDRFANKMLVLIDGRVVYTPTFSGVFWDVQDVLLEDVSRIEVIRGPGATLWGANGMNGVINIITKGAKETQGGLIAAGAGNEEHVSTSVRYGAKTKNGAYRIFAKYFDRQPFDTATGTAAPDGWHILRGGFRSDWDLSPRDTLTLQGDIYGGHAVQIVPRLESITPLVSTTSAFRAELSGDDLLTRWHREFSPRSDITLQAYYDQYERLNVLGDHRRTGDVDFQHHLIASTRNEITWGVGLRYTADHSDGSLTVSLVPSRSHNLRYSAFFQDEISIVPDRLRLTLGMRYEDDNYTGPEVFPDARLIWTPTKRRALWMAISRPVRTPARTDLGLRVTAAGFPGPGGLPTLVVIQGNPEIGDEYALSYQLGYRAQFGERVSVDLTGFHTLYSGLRGVVPGAPYFDPIPVPHLVFPQVFQNSLWGTTDGTEAASTWQVMRLWKISGAYTWLRMDIHGGVPSAQGADIAAVAGTSPSQQFNLRSYLNLPHDLEFDTFVYFVGKLPAFGVPPYTRLDARIAWHPNESSELSLVGQNLLDARHDEFGSVSQGLQATQVKRSIFAKFMWRFH
jgi:iron complex outermembrane receptor protein